MKFEFDRDASVAKFGKDQNLADVTRNSRQLTSECLLNLEASLSHLDQEESDPEDADDKGSQVGKDGDV